MKEKDNNKEIKLKSEYYNNHDIEKIQRREEANNGMLVGYIIAFFLFLFVLILIVLFVK